MVDHGLARAVHDELPAPVVEVFRTELRVDELPLEILAPRESGVEGLVIVIIARAETKPARCRRRPCTLAVLHRHRPARRGAVPIGAHDLAVEPDALANMALIDDAIEIFEDRRAVGDRFFMLPRFEEIGSARV